MPASTRTDSSQGEIGVCPNCASLFRLRRPTQRFCGPKCRAAHAREVGQAGILVSSRRLRRRISLVIHTEDEAVLSAPLGTRYRLVREP